MDRKKNIFSMYRVLLLAVALPLVAVLLGVTTASTKATSKYYTNICSACQWKFAFIFFHNNKNENRRNFLWKRK